MLPSALSSSTPSGWRNETGLTYPASGGRSKRRTIAFLVVEAAKSRLCATTMFQTFRRLLYHWHDAGSGNGRFGKLYRQHYRIARQQQDGEGPFAEFSRRGYG